MDFITRGYPCQSEVSTGYALVGMVAFFSGAAHAPVTSILILFEMMGDYRIILPLGKLVKSEFTHIKITSTAAVVEKRIMDIDLPEECLIVSVHRGSKCWDY